MARASGQGGGTRPVRVGVRVSPARPPEGETRGWIVPIGGAEAKEGQRPILERVLQLAGGRDARIGVIPTASQLPDTGPRYQALFRELGAAEVVSMDFDTRRDCEEPSRLDELRECTGIFLTGETNCGSPPCWAAPRWPDCSGP